MRSAADDVRTCDVTHRDYALTVEDFGTLTGNGAFTITISDEGGVATTTLSAEELTTVGLGVAETLLDYTLQLVDRGDPFELTFRATLQSGRLGGAVSYETIVPFSAASGSTPDAGELLVTGGGGSNVRLVAESATDVRLELDEDGDGSVDPNGIVPMTWESLEDLP